MKTCKVCGKQIANARTYCSMECYGKDHRHYSTCVICGKKYQAPPSDKRSTCANPECVRENKVRKHTGKSNKWPEESKAKISGVQTDNLKMGTPSAQKSPIAGRFETNQNAKDWILISPEGKEYRCRNLTEWARNHCDLFGKEPGDRSALQITAGFRAIATSLRGNRKTSCSTYFGWTLLGVPQKPEK